MILAHLSDPHVADLSALRVADVGFKVLSGAMNVVVNRRHHYRFEVLQALMEDLSGRDWDHLAVTGDIASLGLRAEMEKVRGLFEPLGPDRVTVIPGNHDTYTRVSVRHRRFKEVFASYFTSHLPSKHSFPLVRFVGNIALVGLNTSRPTPPLVAVGEVGPDQMGRLEVLLEAENVRSRFVVLMLHHHLDYAWTPDEKLRRLVDGERLRAVIRSHRVNLIIHGHIHRAYSYRVGAVPVYCSGSASRVSVVPQERARVNYYHIEGDQLLKMESRVFDPEARQVLNGGESSGPRPWNGRKEVFEGLEETR